MDKSEDFMLTTYDNPFNPFKEFENWFKMDLILGWNCCGLLAKEANTSEVFSDEINEEEEFFAMKRIVDRWPMIFKIMKDDGEEIVGTLGGVAKNTPPLKSRRS